MIASPYGALVLLVGQPLKIFFFRSLTPPLFSYLRSYVIQRLGENAKHSNLEAVNTESLGESFFAKSSSFGISMMGCDNRVSTAFSQYGTGIRIHQLW